MLDCNSNYRFDEFHSFEIPEKIMLQQLNESIKSGLIVDRDNGIFIREGYGALVGFCPENCSTIDDVLKFTFPDFKRKTVGKPTIKEKIREIISGDYILSDPYYGYNKLVDQEYDLVIGPGCMVYGQQWEKAIYCRNYEEILKKTKAKAKSKSR